MSDPLAVTPDAYEGFLSTAPLFARCTLLRLPVELILDIIATLGAGYRQTTIIRLTYQLLSGCKYHLIECVFVF